MGLLLRAGLLLCYLLPARAVVFNVMAPPDAVTAGGEVTLHLIMLNPDAEEVLVPVPEVVAARLSSADRSWPVEMHAAALTDSVPIAPGGFAVLELVLTLPAEA